MGVDTEQLKELGFTKAAGLVDKRVSLQRRLTIAYEHYRRISPENMKRFNQELRKKTEKKSNQYGETTYNQLHCIALGDYTEVPPQHVLDNLKIAKDRKIFDHYEIAKIKSVVEVPDPLLLGCLKDCEDKFFIDQWMNDVKIDDILREDEG